MIIFILGFMSYCDYWLCSGIGTQRSNPAIGGERAPLLSLSCILQSLILRLERLIIFSSAIQVTLEQKELLFRSIATLLSKNGLSESADVLMQGPHSIGSK